MQSDTMHTIHTIWSHKINEWHTYTRIIVGDSFIRYNYNTKKFRAWEEKTSLKITSIIQKSFKHPCPNRDRSWRITFENSWPIDEPGLNCSVYIEGMPLITNDNILKLFTGERYVSDYGGRILILLTISICILLHIFYMHSSQVDFTCSELSITDYNHIWQAKMLRI